MNSNDFVSDVLSDLCSLINLLLVLNINRSYGMLYRALLHVIHLQINHVTIVYRHVFYNPSDDILY